MRVKELLGLAAQGLVLPGDQNVDDILAKADRIRRRRRIAMAAGSAAAVVAVGIGTALLPQPGLGAPDSGYAASAPPSIPGATSEPAPTTGSTMSATTGTSAPPPPLPSSSPTGASPPASSSATTPRTTSPTTGSKSTATSTGTGTSSKPPSATSTTQAKSPTQIVATLLGSAAGTVRKLDSAAATGDTANPLSGRYTVTKDGKTGYLDVVVYDPKVTGPSGRTVTQETAYNYCADNGTDAPNTDCDSTPGDGSVLKSWTVPAGQQASGTQDVTGKGYGASFVYADGRGVRVTASAGISGSNPYGPPMTEPPVTKTALAELVGETSWFKS